MPELEPGLLPAHRRLLLLGASGCGKSYHARRLAREALAQANYQLSYAELSAPEQDLLNHFGGPLRRLQLHPAWNYELFIEGLRPEVVQGQASAVLRDGAFKRFCRDAAAYPDRSWCLVLDDVHRCQIASLFGDTLPLLESPEARVWLPASGDSLTLGPRAWLIATCQRAYLPELDPAWLRHFAVIELEPDYTVLPVLTVAGRRFDSGLWLQELNQRLYRLIGERALDEALGQGYCFQDGQPPWDFIQWQQRFQRVVWPRLRQLGSRYGFALSELLGDLSAEGAVEALADAFAGAFEPKT